MKDHHTYTYDLGTFSADGAFAGPVAQTRDAATDYLAQRMADQHCGYLGPIYWRSEAIRLLSDAQLTPGVMCRRRVRRARGVSVTAIVSAPAAEFAVTIFPIFDDGSSPPEACASTQHPRLAIAMAEAGGQADAWLRRYSDRKGTARPLSVTGFDVRVEARLNWSDRIPPPPREGGAAVDQVERPGAYGPRSAPVVSISSSF